MMIKKISTHSVALLFSLIFTWCVGFIIISSKHYLASPWSIWLYGILNTIIATGIFTLITTPFYYIGRNRKLVPTIVLILYSLILILEMLSLFYFTMTLEPLGNTIFQFSWGQATLILDNYFVFKWYYLLLPLPVLLFFTLIRWIKINKRKRLIFYILLASSLPALFFGLQFHNNSGSFASLSENKTIYFIQSILENKTTENHNLSEEEVAFYQKETNPRLQDKNYPLYQKPYQENPLQPFFDLKETSPNIVFLVVESLSSSFSGPEADEISYTPFLDSLAQHSLYFDNSLATAERSFAVLPSMLGSLPHGKSGFTHNKSGYPNNETLATWLFSNGYVGDFHFGGYARFDYMDLFMNNQGFKNIYDRDEYNYEGTGLKTSIDSIPFGIPDKPFLKSILKTTKARKNKAPFLDVYLTLSMHYPYMIEDHEEYYKKVEKRIEESNAEATIKEKHQKYIAEFATFLYTDDALRYYFQEQKKRKSHNNTIYVILGDHMMGEIPQQSPIERYRSVLMIYSPLLKRHAHFKGVNSQLDIAPSFYNLLQHEYNYPQLDSVSWLGQPFDTSHVFHSNRDILFMLNNRKTIDLLHKNFYLSNDYIYKVSDRLQLTPIYDKEKKKFLKKLLTSSTLLHKDVVDQNRLIPYQSELEVIERVNKEIHINENIEFSNVFNRVLVKPYKEIIFELNVQLMEGWSSSIENNVDQPLLICSIKRGEEDLLWDKIDLDLNEKPLKNKRKLNYIVKNNIDFDLLPGDEVSIYFWNKKKSKIKYSALIIPLTVKAKAIE